MLTKKAPSVPSILALPTTANVLQASLEMFEIEDGVKPLLTVSTADRRLSLLDPRDSFNVVRSVVQFQDSPVLTYIILSFRYIVCGCMSGSVFIYDLKLDQVINRRKEHSKYVVRLAVFDAGNGHTWIASAGWDRKIFIYNITAGNEATPAMQNPIAHIELATNPEDIVLTQDPDSGRTHLLVTRRDSTCIYFYDISHLQTQGIESTSISATGQQNLAPHSSAWIAFTPAAMALNPTDRSRVAIAASTVPHMRVLVVRLLFPSEKSHPDPVVDLGLREGQREQPTLGSAPAPSAGSQIRARLAQEDRERAAIYLHCNAFAPQTLYSTPAIAWRPDGSGLWVNSDDGVIRGLEASTGKVIASLEGHEPGSKIRCLWAGWANPSSQGDSTDEWIISGGFDQRLIAWRTTSSGPTFS